MCAASMCIIDKFLMYIIGELLTCEASTGCAGAVRPAPPPNPLHRAVRVGVRGREEASSAGIRAMGLGA